MQVHAASLGHAAVQVALLAHAATTPVRGDRGFSGSNLGLSNVGGGLVNLAAGNAFDFATVTVDGRNKTVGLKSARSDAIRTTTVYVGVLSTVAPPVMSLPELGLTTGMQTPPVVRPSESTAPPGPEF